MWGASYIHIPTLVLLGQSLPLSNAARLGSTGRPSQYDQPPFGDYHTLQRESQNNRFGEALHFDIEPGRPSDGGTANLHVIFSTDNGAALVGPNAGYDECPAQIQSGLHGPIAYRDVDDAMAMTLAMNSDSEGLTVDLIVPTFGDAAMPANFMTAKQLVHNIKGRTDIPIVPGAMTASQPPFIDAWSFNPDMTEIGWGGSLPVASIRKPLRGAEAGNSIDPVELFKMSCHNIGVLAMQEKLLAASHGGYKVTLLGIGPMTDYACLLLTTDTVLVQNSVDRMVLLIGQEAGVPFGSVGATGRDFNMVMDPLAATIVLSFSSSVDITLMEFQLTRQTNGDPTKNPKALVFNDETFAPGTLPFFREAKKSARKTEGPFDQYTVAYALHPEWFKCDQYPVYTIQCSDNASATGNSRLSATECTSAHTYDDSSYTLSVSAELTIDRSSTFQGPLVIGNAQGNILAFRDVPRANPTVCTDFASPEAYESFRSFVYNLH